MSQAPLVTVMPQQAVKRKTAPRRLNLITHQSDQDVFILGMLGWGTDAIARRVRLSPCQVSYRLVAWGIKRADYRNGGPLARELIDAARDNAALTKRLQRAQEDYREP